MLTAILMLLLGVLVILAIIAANGYFVAQEFAYMSVDRSRLGALADNGDKSAQRALTVTKRTSFMLSGAQLGITVTGLLVGYVAEPLVGRSLGVILGGIGVPDALGISVGTVLALTVATVVQMVFGELYPKNLAIANAEPLARRLAYSTNIYLVLFGWLITVFDKAANGFLRQLKIEPVHDIDSSATARDLEHIVADSRESGDLPKELSIILDRILDFPQRDVEHAMVPRSRADMVEPEMTIREVRALMAEAHTRYPVINSEDDPVGIVHLVDVLATSPESEAPVTTIMHPPLVLPTLMSLPEARRRMIESQNKLACIIDEYGGFTGILTLEDLAEEVVGEISDEHDEEAPVVVESNGRDTWEMRGDVHVDEAEREIGYQLPRGEYETVAGMLIDHDDKLPAVHETIRVELPPDPGDLVQENPVHRYLEAQILEVDQWVPTLVHLTLNEVEDDRDAAPAANQWRREENHD